MKHFYYLHARDVERAARDAYPLVDLVTVTGKTRKGYAIVLMSIDEVHHEVSFEYDSTNRRWHQASENREFSKHYSRVEWEREWLS